MRRITFILTIFVASRFCVITHMPCQEAVTYFSGITCLEEKSNLPSTEYESYVVKNNKTKLILRIFTIVDDPILESRVLKDYEITKNSINPNILRILEINANLLNILQLTEYVSLTFEDYIIKSRDDPLEQKLLTFQGILTGLSELHNRKLIHGNLNSHSILFTEEMTPKLAHLFDSVETSFQGPATGTLSYMDPTFIRDSHKQKEFTVKVDIYALGVFLFRLTQNGRFPFDQTNPIDLRILHSIGNIEVKKGTNLQIMFMLQKSLAYENDNRPLLDALIDFLKMTLNSKNRKEISYDFTLSNKSKLPVWIQNFVTSDFNEQENNSEQYFSCVEAFESDLNAKNAKEDETYLNRMVADFQKFIPNPFRKDNSKKTKNDLDADKNYLIWKIIVFMLICGLFMGIGFLIGAKLNKRYFNKQTTKHLIEQIEQNQIDV